MASRLTPLQQTQRPLRLRRLLRLLRLQFLRFSVSNLQGPWLPSKNRRISLAELPQQQGYHNSISQRDLPMETFTLWKEMCLQLESPDFIRQSFTMETFALWISNAMDCSQIMEAPIPKGEKHLPMETFTLVAPEMDPSHPGSTQEGPQAPCTNRVYKAAHRRSSKATVSHLTVRPYLLVIANPPGTIPIGFQHFFAISLCKVVRRLNLDSE